MLSKKLAEVVQHVFSEASTKGHEFVTVEHLLLALLDDPLAVEVLNAVSTNIDQLQTNLYKHIEATTPLLKSKGDVKQTRPTQGFHRVIQRAIFHVQSSGRKEVTSANILVAIFAEKDAVAVFFLKQQGINRIDIVNYIAHGISKHPEADEKSDSSDNDAGGEEEDYEDGEEKSNDLLGTYVLDLNEEAKKDRIDPLIGRKAELQRVIQILCRRRKNNPLLVGESGVGKTAIAEGLARQIVAGQVPDVIGDSTIYSLNMGVLLAGTKYRGDFEKRFKMVLGTLQEQQNSILFIDEIHTVIGAGAASGGVMDASNLLKPVLTSGDLRCMGSTTYQEYRGIFDKDRALSRRFQKIDIVEPDVDDTYRILKGLKSRYEEHYSIRYTSKALRAAASLSERHINDRFLPDKAIDVIDEAGAAQKLLPDSRRRKQIGVAEIEQIVAGMARIPPARVTVSDKQTLQNLDQRLKMVIFGQDNAIDTVTSAIRLARAGLKTDKKPVGSFLFAGPTGVGKTEMSQQLALVMGIELLRYDMSEYMERHTVSRLIGAPPGYVGYDQGGLLTEAVTKHPYSVVLLDEIEKAHTDVFNLLLQVMDHGILTDNNGRKADFRNVILIMTTNAGAELAARESIGFAEQDHSSDAMGVIKKMLAPEFLNRLDAIIQFGPLSPDVVATVVDKFLVELQAQVDDKRIVIHADDEALSWLARHGYDEKMGARPMQRLIQREIKHKLAEFMLFGELAEGGDLYITVKKGKLALEAKAAVKGRG